MKTIALFLSLMVVVLSITPCCAIEDHLQQTRLEKQLATEKNPSDNCFIGCSPFYTCGTCSGLTVILFVGVTSPTLSIAPITFNNDYFQPYADGADRNIWQPPKLLKLI
ncbi:MAG: hypothetical protein V4541_00775 [Bacteroidota bacterium]